MSDPHAPPAAAGADSGGDRPVIAWFRNDLRLADNPALIRAAETGRTVVPVYVFDHTAADDAAAADDGTPGPGGNEDVPGAAARWWLHGALESLAADLAARGAPLILRRGPAARIIEALARETGAAAVYWNRAVTPQAAARDHDLALRLRALGVEIRAFKAALLFDPDQVRTRSGGPYKVFTPFWRACLNDHPAPPLPKPAPARLAGPASPPRSEDLTAWRLRPTRPDWAAGLRATWVPGEAAARDRLARFLDAGLAAYAHDRDRPDIEGTSRLSPHLHFGEIGPRQVFHAVRHRMADGGGGPGDAGAQAFLSELGWREFSYHQLHHFPALPARNLRPAFDRFPWRADREGLAAWTRGQTGYPMVDAGMRQLWHTGWMHNRVRMIAASFLVKHLMVHWREGAAWFCDTLVDGDVAANAANWQWVAGSGADAAPYFRIFNPVTQGRKFDPQGAYVRRWVPELAKLPDRFIHAPWEAPADTLRAAGVTLGRTYARPIVAHDAARARALAAYQTLKQAA